MLSMLLFTLVGIGALLAVGAVVATALLYGSEWEALAREMRGHDATAGFRPLPAHREMMGAFAGTGFRAIPVAVGPRHERRVAA